jgi:Protein of unknown function (DUF2577)
MNRERLEGDGVTRLIQLMRRYGYNKDVDIYLGTVTNPLPDVRIKLDKSKIELEADDLIINRLLLNRVETVKINGVTQEIEYPDTLTVGTRVILAETNNNQLFYVLGIFEKGESV